MYVEWIVLLPFVNCSFFCSLDTFPYAGTTTTCESLYMGVPCVTMAGSVHAHNVGVSLLSNVGMESTLIFVFDVDFNIFYYYFSIAVSCFTLWFYRMPSSTPKQCLAKVNETCWHFDTEFMSNLFCHISNCFSLVSYAFIEINIFSLSKKEF